MNLSLIFRVVNIIAAAFLIIGGVMTCFAGGFPNFIQGIFVAIFGVMTAVFEFRLPPMVTQFASFMFSFLGRGIFYLFLGCITLNYNGLALASGIIVAVIGLAFIVLHFTKIEAPSNMQKGAFETAAGYSTHVDNNPSTPQQGGFGQSNFQAQSSPQYPPANYANPGAV